MNEYKLKNLIERIPFRFVRDWALNELRWQRIKRASKGESTGIWVERDGKMIKVSKAALSTKKGFLIKERDPVDLEVIRVSKDKADKHTFIPRYQYK